VPVGPESMEIAVGPSKVDVNFGYDLDFGDILEDLDPSDPDEDGVILSGIGKTIGFWKHQLSVIEKGRGKAQVSKSEIDALIGAVNSFFLPDPFVISSYKFALSILDSTSPVAEELLKKQLLAAEFNKFYGIGLDNHLLMNLILQYAESALYLDALPKEEVLLIKDVLDAINNLGH
jgi:hypothetical protein